MRRENLKTYKREGVPRHFKISELSSMESQIKELHKSKATLTIIIDI